MRLESDNNNPGIDSHHEFTNELKNINSFDCLINLEFNEIVKKEIPQATSPLIERKFRVLDDTSESLNVQLKRVDSENLCINFDRKLSHTQSLNDAFVTDNDGKYKESIQQNAGAEILK